MRYYSFLLLLLIAFNLEAQIMQSAKKTIVYKQTADWCGPCGDWGWKLFDSLNVTAKSDPGFRGFLVSLHDQSTQPFLNASIASAIVNNANPPSSGYPSFFVNNRDIAGIPTYVSFGINGYIIDEAVDSIKSKVSQETSVMPDAAVGFSKLQSQADSLVFKGKVRFQKNTSGEYRLAIYVLEDSVMGWQTNQTGSVPHKQLLRGDVQHGVWGSLLQNGPVSVNQEYEQYFRMKLPSAWNLQRLRFLAIVYKKDPVTNKYIIDNVTDQYATGVNSIYHPETTTSLSVFPNPACNRINILSSTDLDAAEFYLTDCSGRMVSLAKDSPGAKREVSLRLPGSLALGVYNLHIRSEYIALSNTVVISR